MRIEFKNLQIPLPIAIVGLGISGFAARQLLIEMGVEAQRIVTFDEKNPAADFSSSEKLISEIQPASLCVSPGVPLSQSWIQACIRSGVRLTSELEIAFALLDSEKVIAVTGSVGKSTTTSLLGVGASRVESRPFVGGNLGLPLADYSREVLTGKRERAQHVILELSSYQLENFQNLKSEVSLLTSLNPNHLERYENLQHYYSTKFRIFRSTRSSGILNRNGGDIVQQRDRILIENPALKWRWTSGEDPAFRQNLPEAPRMIGSHNMDNLAMAFAVAELFSWPQESLQAMVRFPGLAHRLENCGTYQGILFLNDSKSTTVNSVLQAVSSVRQGHTGGRIHLLIGGQDKGLPWQELTALQGLPNFSFYFFGQVGLKAKSESGLDGMVFPRLSDCLPTLGKGLRSGDVVLFSPGGTSFDEFKNFEERGSFFKNWISLEFEHRKN